MHLMQDAAPVFRRACPEPPDQPVNLPNALLNPDLTVRYFSAGDVMASVVTARPQLFKYDVSHTPETAERLMNAEFGLQWLHGFPNQFVILLALISGLHEDIGTHVDPHIVSDIEEQIRSVTFPPALVSSDPFLGISRLVVLECWRQAVYIYLYMVRVCSAFRLGPWGCLPTLVLVWSSIERSTSLGRSKATHRSYRWS
jgi:hypothetical protein